MAVMKVTTPIDKNPKNKKPTPNFKFMRDRDREKVRGKFIFHEVPGGMMSFVFRAYKEDPIERFDLQDGEIYSLPLGVARHLNKNCWYPEHAYQLDEGGNPIMRVGRKVRRCSFQSLEFVDIDDIAPVGVGDIVTVQTIGSPEITNEVIR